MKSLDTFFMRLALKEAAKGEGDTEPNPMVGCVLVRPDLSESASDRKVRLADPRGAKISGRIPRIVGIGYHHRFSAPHAEVEALQQAGKKARGATAYVTLEPCQMCAGAIVQARIPLVVIGCKNEKAGCAGSILDLFNVDKFNHKVEKIEGVLEEECSHMLTDFFKGLRLRLKSEREINED